MTSSPFIHLATLVLCLVVQLLFCWHLQYSLVGHWLYCTESHTAQSQTGCCFQKTYVCPMLVPSIFCHHLARLCQCDCLAPFSMFQVMASTASIHLILGFKTGPHTHAIGGRQVHSNGACHLGAESIQLIQSASKEDVAEFLMLDSGVTVEMLFWDM